MNTRKSNETLYQNNAVELNEEALTKVIGGCGNPGIWEQPWGQDCNGYGNGSGEGDHRQHCPGLLSKLLCDLL
jgi:hypothetical protein